MKLAFTIVLVLMTGSYCAEDATLGKLVDDTLRECKDPHITVGNFTGAIGRVIDAITPLLGVPDEAARKEPQHQLDRFEFAVSRPETEDQRLVYCLTMAKKLETELPVPTKIWLLKSLERIGAAESVGAEVKLLSDANETVRETARRALAANSSKEASAELRKAIEKSTEPKMRTALIEALGFKRDKADASIFEKESENPDASVKAAALAALAAQGVRKDSGPQAEAAQLVELGRGGKAEGIPKLIAALESPHNKVRQAAVQAANLNSSSEMTSALIAKLSTASTELKPALILLLAQRGGKAVQEAFKAELGNPEGAIRIAAIQGLGLVGDASSVTPLMALALSKQGEEQRAARDSLDRLRGAAVDSALVLLLSDSNPAQKIEAAQRLAGRSATAAAQPLVNLLGDNDEKVRLEALKALGMIGGKETLPQVVAFLGKTDKDGERDQAAKSAVAIARRLPDADGRAEPIVNALPGTEPARIALLGALGQIGGKQALDAVHTYMKDGSEKTEDAAFRALANWPDAAPLSELRDIARASKNETQRVLALRGFVRMAAMPGSRSPAETLQLFADSMDAVKTTADKKLFLGALADIKDIAAVDACAKFIADPAVTEEACVAVVKAARNLENNGNLKSRVNVIKEAVAHLKNKKAKDEAQALLGKLEKK